MTTKAQLISDLHAENRQWEALLDEISPARMDRPIAPGQWSVRDIVAHIAGWRRRTVARLRAAARGEPEPPPEWPTHLGSDDEINDWLHAASRDQPVSAVLADSRQLFHDLVAAVEALPEEGLLEPGRFAWMGGEPLSARALFGHFHDEHEADMRRWLDAAQGA
jgi:hypothetical protein